MNTRARGVLRIGLMFIFCRIVFSVDRLHYIISLENPEQHLVQVTMEIPPGQSEHELQLPVWNALYQVRDFSQYMNWIRADDSLGKPLHLTQLNQSRWKIAGAGNGARVWYEIFSDDPGPYGAQLNSQHAFFNLAEILGYVEDQRGSSAVVEFRNLPAGWKIGTPLSQQGSVYSADNYDRLVDSPVEIGEFDEADFAAACGNYRVIVDSAGAPSILAKIVPSIQRIVSAATNWMSDCPFHNYMFIYHLSDSTGDGGMEHAYSTAITLPARDVADDLDTFNSTTAHEFFHLWNVERIRPQSLEPVDYTRENYTPALWFSEGVDSTVAEYIRLRAGLLDEQHYLGHLGKLITELENRPAHLTQSAEESSIDAWLEKYPYYRLPARSISYYNKGELLGLMLDLAMRDVTNDQASLRELFRWMNDHYPKQGKLFPDSEGVRQAAEVLTHADFREFFENYVSGVDEIPWNSFFSRVGLQVTTTQVISADPGFQAVQELDQPPTVVQVQPGSGAERAGLKPGDIIVQVSGQLAGRDFERLIVKPGPGKLLTLLIRRDSDQHQLHWKLGSRKQLVFQVDDLPGLNPQQRARRAAWLFGNAGTSSRASPSAK